MHKWLLLTLALGTSLWALPLDKKSVQQAARQVWKNECSGTIEGLTSWNVGEDFPSLGIGHFIWYKPGQKGRFSESFPDLVKFLEEHGQAVPDWLKHGCPWASREEFLADRNGPRLTALRQLLSSTVDLQAEFMAARLNAALPRILKETDQGDKVEARFKRVFQAPGGLYPLLDYVNFKGEGISKTERYQGQGWGLLQVLENMKDLDDPLHDFAQAAHKMMDRRVANSPPERNEQRWLRGWHNRINSYE
jgi:hypothetical protein